MGYTDITVIFDAIPEAESINIVKSESEGGAFAVIANVPASDVSYVDKFGTIGSWYAVEPVISGFSYGNLRNLQRGFARDIDLAAEQVRMLLPDPTFTFAPQTREELGTASGSSASPTSEIFEVDYLPIVAYGVFLWVGRQPYELVINSGFLDSDRNQAIFSREDGKFVIPNCYHSGTVYANYIWQEPRSYKFSDMDIRLFLKNSIAEVNNLLSCSINTTGFGNDLTFASSLTLTQLQALILLATISAKSALIQTSNFDAIYIRDNDTVIDTSRGLRTMREEIKDLKERLKELVENSYLYDQTNETVGYRIDNYSTATDDTQIGLISIGAYQELNNISAGKGLMPGYDNG